MGDTLASDLLFKTKVLNFDHPLPGHNAVPWDPETINQESLYVIGTEILDGSTALDLYWSGRGTSAHLIVGYL